MRSVVLLSGGLDSAANLALAAERDEPVLALTADYGQRAVKAELRAAKALADYYRVPHREISLSWLGQIGGSALTEHGAVLPELARDSLDDKIKSEQTAAAVWVPNRNGILINVAAAFAERLNAARIVVGFNREEAATFPDNSGDFLEAASAALSFSTRNRAKVHCYTTALDKREIVALLKNLVRPFPFELLWSCYEGGERPCGRCESCQRLARALDSASSSR
jgi:7-cyano-7-deazaguanine synthase